MPQIATNREPFIDAHEAAAILGCHVETLRRRARRREIPSYCPNGEGTKPRLFLVSELNEWRQRHAVPEED